MDKMRCFLAMCSLRPCSVVNLASQDAHLCVALNPHELVLRVEGKSASLVDVGGFMKMHVSLPHFGFDVDANHSSHGDNTDLGSGKKSISAMPSCACRSAWRSSRTIVIQWYSLLPPAPLCCNAALRGPVAAVMSRCK